MSEERKKISVKDLKIGDMVVGQHIDSVWLSYNIVAGEIASISTANDGLVTYHVNGKTFLRIEPTKPLNLSVSLTENEVEVIDLDVCNTIIELYKIANKQFGQGLRSAHENAENAHELRHKSRHELEEKYAVGG